MVAVVIFSFPFHDARVKNRGNDFLDVTPQHFLARFRPQTFLIQNVRNIFKAITADKIQIKSSYNIWGTHRINNNCFGGFIIQVSKGGMIRPFTTRELLSVATLYIYT
ncbi:hypothetical protein A3C91_00970 [Candidatus Azambacteria bacterium RIFCSPHIGHO2_02_FULL_52_12]|uniref:Uncharacterized protein n=1 Tax=Candidatus Azambacteria bacterium RIFCSPLOWO2_01_FULL_46_25 TaxID=1797298 RepID=A0A1F5BU22_9BACT|nr:MAG: hypothetical protein A3C91_00970 [Candidatus Azambacteria bacterium RIFCSPHIGHO2_02_FULL_52_12]OGD34094.1 MAG: hypothetical protein A2988_01250 [Candidatus Azambacteria bacterium RIFCSPLOWO2_01_FULL_46_25]OGD36693.1 MAG: hypothetical protein A2850_00205 [Candidatus Azambacteria bacterium RIFCSPHIGHO2_01_FULL_51_74]